MTDNAKPKSRNLFWLRLCLSLILLVILLALFIQPDFRQTLTTGLARLPLRVVGLILLLFIVMRGFQTIMLRQALSALGTEVRTADCARLLGLKGLYNLGITGGGIAAQLAHAKISLGVKGGHFVLATLLQAVLFVSSLLLCFGAIIAGFGAAPFPHQFIVAVVCLGVAFGLVGVVLLSPAASTRVKSSRVLAFIENLRTGTRNRRALRSVVWRIYLYSLGVHVARSFRFTALIVFMASQVPLSFSITAVLGADVVAQLPITPAGIGTRELALGYFGKSLSLFDLFLAGAMIDRAAAICFNVVHGLLSFFALSFSSSGSGQ